MCLDIRLIGLIERILRCLHRMKRKSKEFPDACVGYGLKTCSFVFMNDQIYKSHNSALLLYHLVCIITNWYKLLPEEVSKTLKNICLEITLRY